MRIKDFVTAQFPLATNTVRRFKGRHLRGMSTEAVFEDIFRQGSWRDSESISGPGSNTHQTRTLVTELPRIIKALGIRSIADIPCGDFNWMKDVDLSECHYIGGDIVRNIIEANIINHSAKGRLFMTIDIIRDPLPATDAILVRDCLVHFSNEDAMMALENIRKTSAKYLLATTFSNVKANTDILTGQHRAMNLELKPFSLGPAAMTVSEESPSPYSQKLGKSIGVWKLRD
jgi:hypothetical protein